MFSNLGLGYVFRGLPSRGKKFGEQKNSKKYSDIVCKDDFQSCYFIIF